jgi:hypothetical protein
MPLPGKSFFFLSPILLSPVQVDKGNSYESIEYLKTLLDFLKILVWPLLIFFIVFHFRNEIRQSFLKISNFSFKFKGIDFTIGLKDTEEAFKEIFGDILEYWDKLFHPKKPLEEGEEKDRKELEKKY